MNIDKRITIPIIAFIVLIILLFSFIKLPHNIRSVVPSSPELTSHRKKMEEAYKKNGYYTQQDMDKLEELTQEYIDEKIYKRTTNKKVQ